MPIELIHGFLVISAESSQDGKFSLLGGGFDAIEVPAFPAAILSLAIIVRIRIPHDEAGRPHLVRARMVGPGELNVAFPATNIDVRNRPGPHVGPFKDGMISNIVVSLYGVTLTAAGVYKVEFLEAREEADKVFGTMELPVFDAATIHGGR